MLICLRRPIFLKFYDVGAEERLCEVALVLREQVLTQISHPPSPESHGHLIRTTRILHVRRGASLCSDVAIRADSNPDDAVTALDSHSFSPKCQ